jgi:ADP-ribose pyrophosphatase YjhB (NUDIX family)
MKIKEIAIMLLTSIRLENINPTEISEAELPIRESARLIVLDAENNLLLMQIKLDKPADPNAPILTPYWVTVGGGVNEGETLREAAIRELKEETGLDCPIQNKIWHGRWRQGNKRINDETYFLVRHPEVGGIVDQSGLEEDEKHVISNMKWWDLDELSTSSEVIIPKDMIELVREIISGNIPRETLEIDLSTPH